LQEEECSSNKQTQPGKLQMEKAPNKNFRKAKFFVYKEEMSTHMMQLSKTPLSVSHVKCFFYRARKLCLDSL
jgi:hypothetical protein